MFNLPHISTEKELVDKSFRRGSKVASRTRSSRSKLAREIRIRNSEQARIQSIAATIKSDLSTIIKKFPSYEQLPEFYQRLLDIQISRDKYKKSLGAMKWCSTQTSKLEREYLQKLRKGDLNASKSFMGRISSVIKRISPELSLLIEIKTTLLEFPGIEEIPCLVIAGYPNAGKSTFMKNLTGSKVKIASYPFTTTKLLLGHTKLKYQSYQIIDTPGLLDRPMEKRNRIECQAILSLDLLADKILFLLDPTQPLGPQLNLLSELEQRFKSPIFAVVNKSDLSIKEELAFPRISAINPEDCRKIFKEIFIS